LRKRIKELEEEVEILKRFTAYWVKDSRPMSESGDDKEEVRRLRRRVADLEEEREIARRLAAFEEGRAGRERIYRFIRSESGSFSVARLCKVCGVARSAYYEWLGRRDGPGEAVLEEAYLANRIFDIWRGSRGRYGEQRWLGDVKLSLTGLNWAHLYQCLRQRVPDDLYWPASTVELIETGRHGTRLHPSHGHLLDFDLVVCADGYRSLGRSLVDPDVTPTYRGMVIWRGLLRENDVPDDALEGNDSLRIFYKGGHGVAYYIPATELSAEREERLLMWAYYLQVPEGSLSSVLVDDQEWQQSSSVPFGKVHPEVKAQFESRLANLLPAGLFDLVQQTGNSSIQAIYSVVPRFYVRDRVCLVGDAGALFPPFTASGVLKAMSNAISLVDVLDDVSTVDDALRHWSDAQLQIADRLIPLAEHIEKRQVLAMPDVATMPATATNHWMSGAFPGFEVTLPKA
jgi:2-polyprenyl-6-methoxyphenol hydroxylase-like FAD-dependent oxidoreductase